MSGTAEAARSKVSPLALYGRARVAELTTASNSAISSYAAALALDPSNATIAFWAYREAVDAGDFALAMRAAEALDRAGEVPPDAHILFYIAALRDRDWRSATSRLDGLSRESGIGFIAPLMGKWLPGGFTPSVARHDRTNAYAEENDALIALSDGGDAGGAVIRALWPNDPYRDASVRIAAASTLADIKRRDAATALVADGGGSIEAAHRLILDGKHVGVSVNSPASGAAFLLARLSGDLITQGSRRSALTMARFAQFADPKNPRIRLILAGALASAGRDADALLLADELRTDPVYGNDAASLGIDELEALGRTDDAIVEARARAPRSANDLSRIGDIEVRRGRFAEAATAYRDAIAAFGERAAPWTLWYAAGNALDIAGDWAAAKPMYERALTLVPNEPVILNALGYGLIDRGEDLRRGETLIAKAAALRPDDSAIADSLGWAKVKSGALKEGISALERAVALDNRQGDSSEHLGDAYWLSGRKIDARYAWAAAKLLSDPAGSDRLAGKIANGLARPAE